MKIPTVDVKAEGILAKSAVLAPLRLAQKQRPFHPVCKPSLETVNPLYAPLNGIVNVLNYCTHTDQR